MSSTSTETQLKYQLVLLRSAIGNAIDKNPNVNWITYNEILEWIDDILEMMEQ